MPEEDRWTYFKDDGSFLVEFNDFLSIFTDVVVNNNPKIEYNSIVFKGIWNDLTPGLPTFKNFQAVEDFGNNPQIVIDLKKVTDCVFTLVQDDGRFWKQEFPFKK